MSKHASTFALPEDRLARAALAAGFAPALAQDSVDELHDREFARWRRRRLIVSIAPVAATLVVAVAATAWLIA